MFKYLFFQDSNNDGIQGAAHHPGTYAPNLPSDFAMTTFAPASMPPLMVCTSTHI